MARARCVSNILLSEYVTTASLLKTGVSWSLVESEIKRVVRSTRIRFLFSFSHVNNHLSGSINELINYKIHTMADIPIM